MARRSAHLLLLGVALGAWLGGCGRHKPPVADGGSGDDAGDTADSGSPVDSGIGDQDAGSPLDAGNPYVANAAQLCGTWVLTQVASPSDLNASVLQALRTPMVRGFSARFPWSSIDSDFGLLNASKALADDAGVAFAVRFMAGRWTPSWVFDGGSPYYLVDAGEPVPTPFFADGGPNTVFEAAYDQLVQRLVAWCVANNVRELHLPWYGQDYAELNNGFQVRAQPGYDAGWLLAHERLVDIALRDSASDGGSIVAVEFPLSGYGPLNTVSPALADYIVSQVGTANPRIFIQANGWGGSDPDGGTPLPDGGNVRDWGPTSDQVESALDVIWQKPICRGEQAIGLGNYDWAALYADLMANTATYSEVYYQSFLTGDGGLQAQVAAFAQACANQVPLP